jgi:hypothetical protein
MKLRYYFPLSVAIFAVVLGALYRLPVPLLPFALILLAGETLVGFQLEDHKVPRLLRVFLRACGHDHKARMRPLH